MGRGMPWRARSQMQLDENGIRVGQLWRFKVCCKPWLVREEEYNALVLGTRIAREGGFVRILEMSPRETRQIEIMADDLAYDAFLYADV
jgi:hypothetical protein